MSRAFRREFVSMLADVARDELRALGCYSYGDHVRDPLAFIRRCGKVRR